MRDGASDVTIGSVDQREIGRDRSSVGSTASSARSEEDSDGTMNESRWSMNERELILSLEEIVSKNGSGPSRRQLSTDGQISSLAHDTCDKHAD